jgi:hypothetical protein
MDADPDLVAMRRQVEECRCRLSTPDRRSVRAAVANSVLEGYQPTPDGIALLIEFAAREITVEQYKARVLDQLGLRHHSAESD